MPIYAYRCATCGHAKDVLQKISDPLLTTCPSCGAEAFQKQVTAAGFQLKGSGWYVTDFRGGATPSGKDDAPAGDKSAGKDGEKSPDKSPDKPPEKSAEKMAEKAYEKAASPTPAPAAKSDAPAKAPPAAAPASSAPSTGK